MHTIRRTWSERVKTSGSGQLIGYVGRSGHTTGANLHFEVRHNNVAKNPLAYLLLPPAYDDHATRLAGGGGSRYFPAQ